MRSKDQNNSPSKLVKYKTLSTHFIKMQTPKRFARKRETSQDSVDHSRTQKLSQNPKKSTSKNPEINQLFKKGSVSTTNLFDIITSPGYIKPSTNLKVAVDSQTSPKLARKTEKFQNEKKSKGPYKRTGSFVYPKQQLKIQKVKFDEDVEPRHKNLVDTQQQITQANEDIEFEYKIKCQEILILEDENKTLKESLRYYEKTVREKEELIEELYRNAHSATKQLKIYEDRINLLMKKYKTHYHDDCSPFVSQEQRPLELCTKLDECFTHYLNTEVGHYELILQNLRDASQKQRTLNDNLMMKSSFVDRFRYQAEQLNRQYKKVDEELGRMKKRNTALTEQISNLKGTNSKIRKTLGELRKDNIAKQKTIKSLQNQMPKAKTIEVKEEKKQKFRKERIETESSITFEETDARELENDNNMSFNISDVSTEELIETQDLL